MIDERHVVRARQPFEAGDLDSAMYQLRRI
jgi:hypothetical protein